MAFPTTGVLDSFTGPNENPITTNWTVHINSAHGDMQRLSNALSTEFAGGSGSAWYDIAQYGPDCEAYLTLATLPDETFNVRLCARLAGVGTASPTGYYLRLSRVAGASNDEVGIFLMNDTQVGTFVAQEFAAGDALGFELIGTTLKGYRKPAAGSWTELISRTDATYSAAGYLGVFATAAATLGSYDDFGGGTVVAGTVSAGDDPPIGFHGRGAGW